MMFEPCNLPQCPYTMQLHQIVHLVCNVSSMQTFMSAAVFIDVD